MKGGIILLTLAAVVGLTMIILSVIPKQMLSSNEALSVLFHILLPMFISTLIGCCGLYVWDRLPKVVALTAALVVAIAFGLVSEVAQIWSPTRVVSRIDLGFDASGAVLGVIVAGLIFNRFPQLWRKS